MSYVSHEHILELHAAALSCDLYRSRDVLLGGIDGTIVSGMRTGLTPSAQMLSDLFTLNHMRLADGSVPLCTWLANAIALAGSKEGAGVIRRVAAAVRAAASLETDPGRSAEPGGDARQRSAGRPVARLDEHRDRWRRAESSNPELSGMRAAVLYVLGMARRPVTVTEIGRLSGVPERHVLEVLQEWWPSLERGHDDNENTRYSASDDLREFLYWQDDVQAAGVEISGTRSTVDDTLEVLFGEE